MMAVGHTSDSLLLDELACYSAKTPTDAAYIILDHYDECANEIDWLYESIKNGINTYYSAYLLTIEKTMQEIRIGVENTIERYWTNIHNRMDLICSAKPEKMLQSGYALLYNEEAELMTKSHIADLQEWELIEVHVYDKKILVEIVKNN